MGIPQGLQKIRDVTVNRHGNFPGLERKPPVKRIGDPANLESDNPAIKAAAEIKQAEDLKMQKIKAIKFLATMGCGCYDKEGKITDALLAAMDDCTPDVRLAAIDAIADTANGECCKSCGSTSCCSEKVTKRLSEIAYERDDNGCMLEPSAEIRAAAAKALKICCPNRATGPIEEDIPDLGEPIKTVPIQGETEEEVEAIEGEGGATAIDVEAETTSIPMPSPSYVSVPESGETYVIEEDGLQSPSNQIPQPIKDIDSTSGSTLQPMPVLLNSASNNTSTTDASSKKTAKGVEVGTVRMIGGMAIQPVTISHVSAIEDAADEPQQATEAKPLQAVPQLVRRPKPVALPINSQPQFTAPAKAQPAPATQTRSVQSKVQATVVGVNHRTGKIALRSGQPFRVGSSVTVYHSYLTGERLVGHLLIESVNGAQAVAVTTDRSAMDHIETGDRAVCF